jgi:hypothetical protein
MDTAPAAASPVLSETAEPPPPVFGAPEGITGVVFLGAGAAVLPAEPLDEVSPPIGTATVVPPDLLVAGVAAAVGFDLVAGAEVDIPAMPGIPDMSMPDIDELDPALAFAVGMATAVVLPPDAAAELAFEVGTATATVLPPEVAGTELALAVAAGIGTATVLPPAAEVAAALASGVAAAVGAEVSAGAAEAAGAADGTVPLFAHSPIRDRTPARTAIAMIAPTTQELLLGWSSPESG